MQSKCSQNAVKMQSKYSQNAVKIQSKFSQMQSKAVKIQSNAIKIQSKFSQNSAKFSQNSDRIQPKFSQNSVKIQSKFCQNSSWSAYRLKSFQSCFVSGCLSILPQFSFNFSHLCFLKSIISTFLLALLQKSYFSRTFWASISAFAFIWPLGISFISNF